MDRVLDWVSAWWGKYLRGKVFWRERERERIRRWDDRSPDGVKGEGIEGKEIEGIGMEWNMEC